MFYGQKYLATVMYCLILLADASLKKHKSEDVSAKKPSSDNNIASDIKQNMESAQLYYLPLQTEYGSSEALVAAGGITTSPPQLIIKPASQQTGYQGSTSVFHEGSLAETHHYKAPFESLCVSETPVNKLLSPIVVPSSDSSKKSVIMSGHLEIASKTNSREDVSNIHNFVSQPSIALQGTMLHLHSASDL